MHSWISPSNFRIFFGVLNFFYFFQIKEIATERGEALAEKYGIKFFETSAKTDVNITKAFTALAKDAKRKYLESPPKPQVDTVHLNSKAQNTTPTSPRPESNEGKSDGGCC